jgi:serine/threonine protein kinase
MKIKDYAIQSEIGRGGMATVYLAEDSKFKHPVAIKLLNKEFIHNGNIRNRFLAEARNLFKMSHPNIIKVTDLIDEGDTVAFVMEYLEGKTLKDYLDVKGKLTDEEIKKFFVQMLEAVGYVHELGLIHRDIKPSNFMISSKGMIKLLDFGIAKNTDTDADDYTQTGTTQNMGTPMYMSPEQIKSTKDVTSQTDIYSLGVVLWQMVMGRKPFDTNTISTFELQTKIVNEPLPPSGTFWDEIIGGATEKKTEHRFSSTIKIAEMVKNNKLTNFDQDITQISPQFNNEETVINHRTTNTENLTESSTSPPQIETRPPQIENKNLFKAPFSFNGRIRRKEFGLSFLIVSTVGIPLSFLIIPIIPLCWFIWAQGAKRAHDLGKSGWYQLIPFYAFVLLFVEGDQQANEYGNPAK